MSELTEAWKNLNNARKLDISDADSQWMYDAGKDKIEEFIDTLREENKRLREKVEELEMKTCEDCLDGSPDEYPDTYGWNHNRVEGWCACGCIEESGPYQKLLDRINSLTCEHGQGLTEYCEPCGRVHGEG